MKFLGFAGKSRFLYELSVCIFWVETRLVIMGASELSQNTKVDQNKMLYPMNQDSC